MAAGKRLPPKKEVMLALLENSTVFVHLDPRPAEVVVPPWFKKQAQLVLQIGLNMAVAIPDLAFDDSGMSCTLSFNRAPHFCRVPWTAIYALVGEDGKGMVWPDDVPPEVSAQGQAQAQKKKPSHLQAVSSGKDTDKEKGAGQPGKSPKAKSRPKRASVSSTKPGQVPVRAVSSKAADSELKAADTPVVGAEAADSEAGASESASSVKAADALRPVSSTPNGKAASKSEPESEDSPGKRKLPPYLRVIK